MEIEQTESSLSLTWYSLNYHALATVKYKKKSVLSGFVYRIFYACSTWLDFDKSLKKAKKLLDNNQYPSSFYEPIINKTLTDIMKAQHTEIKEVEENEDEQDEEKKLIFIQYRGKVTKKIESALN